MVIGCPATRVVTWVRSLFRHFGKQTGSTKQRHTFSGILSLDKALPAHSAVVCCVHCVHLLRVHWFFQFYACMQMVGREPYTRHPQEGEGPCHNSKFCVS